MDDGIKGRKIGSTYMTWVGGIGLASLIVCLGLLGTASLGLWPQSGGGGLSFGGIAPERSFSSEPEKRKGNGNPTAPGSSLPPATSVASTFNAGAASGTGANGGGRDTSKEPNQPKRHKSLPAPAIPAGTPPGHGGTPPGHGGTPPGHASGHGPPPPGASAKTVTIGPPGQLKK
jgi:hypothetical protein